jgi:hypothetical protein
MTLNQQYKASGSTLSFKDWIETQKNLGLVQKKENVKQQENSNVNFDVDYRGITGKHIAIGLGVLALIGVGVWAYKKYKK